MKITITMMRILIAMVLLTTKYSCSLYFPNNTYIDNISTPTIIPATPTRALTIATRTCHHNNSNEIIIIIILIIKLIIIIIMTISMIKH